MAILHWEQGLLCDKLISLDSGSWELHHYSLWMGEPINCPNVEACFQTLNSRPYDHKVDALPHEHGHQLTD